MPKYSLGIVIATRCMFLDDCSSTGAAALLWSYKPTATAADIKNVLMQGVDKVSGASASLSGVSAPERLMRGLWAR